MDRRRHIPKLPEPHRDHREALHAPVSNAARRSAAPLPPSVPVDAEDLLPAQGAAGAAGRQRRDHFAIRDDDEAPAVSADEQQRRAAIRARAGALAEGR